MKFFGGKQSSPRAANSAKKRMADHRKKVAIVGSGCAGMGAAWALKNTDYDVHIFEKSAELGGHTNTQPWKHGDETLPVDTGFIVMNTATYPNFIRFLNEVGVDPRETEMTFGVSRDHGAFEWSGEGRGIFAQRRNFFRPGHWRMIYDIVRFNQFALDIIAQDEADEPTQAVRLARNKRSAADMTIGEYLDMEGYSQAFRDDYLIPMTAAVWSTSPDKCSLEFPAQTLIRFMWNHHLLTTIASRPVWLTIPGGSRRYIDAIIDQFPTGRLHLHTSCEVANVLRPSRRDEGAVTMSWINATSGRIESDSFDHVILACHGDEILPLLAKHGRQQVADTTSLKPSTASPKSKQPNGFVKSSSGVQYVTQEELEVFSAFQTTENVCYLHSDLALMPTRRKTWTSWNYLVNSTPSELSHPAGVSLTYCMNILQHLPEDTYGPVLVTMNPDHAPEPALTQGKFYYRHPLYTTEAIRAQKRLEGIQNVRGVSYCGAWTKYGFHEDGFSSGVRVAMEHLGAKIPFDFVDSTYSRGHKPELAWQDYLLRILLLAVLVWIRLLEAVLRFPLVAPLYHVLARLATMSLNLGEYVGLL